MRRTSLAIFLLLIGSTWALETSLHKKNKAETLTFRIAAVAERTPHSSFAVNAERYLVYRVGGYNQAPAKVVFRYSGFEDGLSDEFLDYGLVHSFKAVRDHSCDETWHSFNTKVVLKSASLQGVVAAQFVSPEAVQPIPEDQLLPCYVIRPQDYKKSERAKSSEATLSTLAGREDRLDDSGNR